MEDLVSSRPGDMRLGLRSADAVCAGEQHDRATKACPLAGVYDDGLRRCPVVRVMDIIAGDLGISDLPLRGEARGDRSPEHVGAAAVDADIDHEAGQLRGILDDFDQGRFQRFDLLHEFVVGGQLHW